jgi:hypothetical protein
MEDMDDIPVFQPLKEMAPVPRTPHCIYELRDVESGRLMAQWDGPIGPERIGCRD